LYAPQIGHRDFGLNPHGRKIGGPPLQAARLKAPQNQVFLTFPEHRGLNDS
jgi:hypothetical protein